MTLQLRVITGSRAGATLDFDKHVVSVGRHSISDLRFDPNAELDVSTRHAEFREKSGAWIIVDEGSTNGTYVNGVRLTTERRLSDGDVVSFGVNGPRVEVHGVGRAPDRGSTPAAATRMQPDMRPSATPPRMDTNVRVAIAVKEQTKGMKRSFSIAIGALAVVAIGLFAWSQQRASKHDAELNALLARGDSALAVLQKNLSAVRPSDTAATRALQEELARTKLEVAKAKEMAKQGASAESMEAFRRRMGSVNVGTIDIEHVVERNDPAMTFIVADLDGSPMGGSGFSIAANGLLVTNKHVVHTEAGAPARRIAVKFANTAKWIPAHIVRASDTDDLALLQLDEAAARPVVSGVSRAGARAKVGGQVIALGFPLSNDTPMEGGSGMNNFVPKTTMTPGTVSKRLDNVLQIDSYSTHGASGSPLFDADGNVVGVIYGGARESAGRIVYAVPAQRLAAFLGADGSSVIK